MSEKSLAEVIDAMADEVGPVDSRVETSRKCILNALSVAGEMGWVLVPLTPTREMSDAADDVDQFHYDGRENGDVHWRVMMAKRPQI